MHNTFLEAEEEFTKIAGALDGLEARCRHLLPGVDWDFSSLRGHFVTIGDEVGEGRPLSASKMHQKFCVTSAAWVMGSVSSEKKRAGAKRVARLGGLSKSPAKVAASRLNMQKARDRRLRKLAERSALVSGEGKAAIHSIRKALRRLQKEIRVCQPGFEVDRLKRIKSALETTLSEVKRGVAVAAPPDEAYEYIQHNSRNRKRTGRLTRRTRRPSEDAGQLGLLG